MSSSTPTRICLFCGSKSGASPAHLTAARALAKALHKHSIHLVYGGGTTGLMGEVARTLVKLSGKDAVTGVIPSSMLGKERPDTSTSTPSPKKEKKLLGNWAKRMDGSSGDHEELRRLLEEEYGRAIIVADLQDRKKKMIELVRDGGPGSGFVALSGGLGTMDELMEVVSLNNMGAHGGGACLLNVGGFWDGVMSWMDTAVEEGFVGEKGKRALGSVTEAEDVVVWLRNYEKGKGK
ncbi:MAG: hypothetical protein Q9170_002613 [Blastenia crenularia]